MNKHTIDLIKKDIIRIRKVGKDDYYSDLMEVEKTILEMLINFDNIKEQEAKANPVDINNLTFLEVRAIENSLLTTPETLEKIYFKHGLSKATFKTVPLKVLEHIVGVESTEFDAVLQSFIAENLNCNLEIFDYLLKHDLSLENVSVSSFIFRNPKYQQLTCSELNL